LLTAMAYYYIYRRNKELIEEQRNHKHINRIESESIYREQEAKINAFMHKTTPILYTYYLMVLNMLTLYNITKEAFEVYDLEESSPKE
jgi:hypothetical protein